MKNNNNKRKSIKEICLEDSREEEWIDYSVATNMEKMIDSFSEAIGKALLVGVSNNNSQHFSSTEELLDESMLTDNNEGMANNYNPIRIHVLDSRNNSKKIITLHHYQFSVYSHLFRNLIFLNGFSDCFYVTITPIDNEAEQIFFLSILYNSLRSIVLKRNNKICFIPLIPSGNKYTSTSRGFWISNDKISKYEFCTFLTTVREVKNKVEHFLKKRMKEKIIRKIVYTWDIDINGHRLRVSAVHKEEKEEEEEGFSLEQLGNWGVKLILNKKKIHTPYSTGLGLFQQKMNNNDDKKDFYKNIKVSINSNLNKSSKYPTSMETIIEIALSNDAYEQVLSRLGMEMIRWLGHDEIKFEDLNFKQVWSLLASKLRVRFQYYFNLLLNEQEDLYFEEEEEEEESNDDDGNKKPTEQDNYNQRCVGFKKIRMIGECIRYLKKLLLFKKKLKETNREGEFPKHPSVPSFYLLESANKSLMEELFIEELKIDMFVFHRKSAAATSTPPSFVDFLKWFSPKDLNSENSVSKRMQQSKWVSVWSEVEALKTVPELSFNVLNVCEGIFFWLDAQTDENFLYEFVFLPEALIGVKNKFKSLEINVIRSFEMEMIKKNLFLNIIPERESGGLLENKSQIYFVLNNYIKTKKYDLKECFYEYEEDRMYSSEVKGEVFCAFVIKSLLI